ncbi:MAG: DJ-1/PfpI family protein, partial [Candidatus Binatia bacterium]
FTDIDLFLMWDVLKRLHRTDWKVLIVGDRASHVSTNGITVATHGALSEANDADVVLFGSGKGTRRKIRDDRFLQAFRLDPARQLVASQCSGALILARLGLLDGIPATTHLSVQSELREFGVRVVDAPLVAVGNMATAGGCLSGLYLAAWVLERTLGKEVRRAMTALVAPVGEESAQAQRIDAALSGSGLYGLSPSSKPAPTATAAGG